MRRAGLRASRGCRGCRPGRCSSGAGAPGAAARPRPRAPPPCLDPDRRGNLRSPRRERPDRHPSSLRRNSKNPSRSPTSSRANASSARRAMVTTDASPLVRSRARQSSRMSWSEYASARRPRSPRPAAARLVMSSFQNAPRRLMGKSFNRTADSVRSGARRRRARRAQRPARAIRSATLLAEKRFEQR